MSEPAIPLWKQELLKRRQKKIFKDGNLVRSTPAGLTLSRPSGITNHSVVENERMSHGGSSSRVPNASNINGSVRERELETQSHGSTGNAKAINATRRIPDLKENRVKSSLVSSGGQSSASPPKIKEGSQEMWSNKKTTVDGSNINMSSRHRLENSDIPRLGEDSCSNTNQIHSSIQLDDEEKDRLKALVGQSREVDDDHIRPRVLKMMWKKQESKQHPELQNSNKANQQLRHTKVNPVPNAGTIDPLSKASPVNNIGTIQPTKKSSSFNHIGVTGSQVLTVNHSQVTTTDTPVKHHLPITTSASKQHSQVTTSTSNHQQKVTTDASRHHSPMPTNANQHYPELKMQSDNPAPPKAYKSPYAKSGWSRPSTITKGKLSPQAESTSNLDNARSAHRHKSFDHEPNRLDIGTYSKEHAREGVALQNRSASMEDINEGKVENEHIPSVKSLLGLFGGKTTACVKRRMRTGDQEVGPKSPVSPTKPGGGLARHHSEPNLYSPKEEPAKSLQESSFDKFQPKADPLDEVVLSNKQVASGIKERMTLLRKRSLSSTSVDEMDIPPEMPNCFSVSNGKIHEGATVPDDPHHSHREQKKNNSEVIKKIVKLPHQTPSATGNSNESVDNITRIGKFSGVISTKPDMDKKLPSNINNDRIIHERICNSGGPKSHLQNMKLDQQNQEATIKQSDDNHLCLTGTRSSDTKQAEVDTKAPKSSSKIVNKQSNYVVQADQSKHSFGDQVLSTTYSNGIKQNQHMNKNILIKNEHRTSEPNIEAKPTKSPLSTIDKKPQETNIISVSESTSQPTLDLCKEPEVDQKPEFSIHQNEADTRDDKADVSQVLNVSTGNGADEISQPAAMPVTMKPEASQRKPVSSKIIPVTPIDVIPVSAIDNVAVEKNSKTNTPNNNGGGNLDVSGTFGTTSSQAPKDTVLEEDPSIEFIPVSAIDDDSSLAPPEIVHEKHPENVKSCLTNNKLEKKGNVSFFQHVFIHDYQSESAAASDWDYENGEAFSSYTPSAVKVYSESELPADRSLPPVSAIDQPEPEEFKGDEPNIVYNEEDSVGFTESFDTTAGAMLF